MQPAKQPDLNTAATDEWWRGAVIYQIYPRSFCDSNGDGLGDLPGITSRLNYIADLGVDAIWLSPFFASPMKDFGYDVSDYCNVDPSFGTLADFDALADKAHALGLKIIIDQVWAHSSDQHAWFMESRARRSKADWYCWADPAPDGGPPNNWLSVFGGPAWSWEPRRRQYYLHHFLSSQPKLNLRCEELVQALFDTGRFWLDRGVDGFRLDALDFYFHDTALRSNPPKPPPDGKIPAKPFGLQDHLYDVLQPEIFDFLGRVRGFMNDYPGLTSLAEVSSQPGAYERVGLYTGFDDRHLHMAYTLRLLKRDFSAPLFSDAISGAEDGLGDGWTCWAFSNHDVERSATRWNGGRPSDRFSCLLAALLLSLRGSICVYQGEELGLPEAEIAFEDMRDPYGITFYPEFKGRDGSRTPIPWTSDPNGAGFTIGKPWLPIPESHRERAVEVQERDPDSVLNTWRHILAWRKDHRAMVTGDIRLIDLPPPLLCFERETSGSTILCVFNLSDQPVSLPVNVEAETTPLFRYGEAGPSTLAGHGVYFGSTAAHWDGAARKRKRPLLLGGVENGGWVSHLG